MTLYWSRPRRLRFSRCGGCHEIRGFKRELAAALRQRRDELGLAALDPESPLWLSQFEMYAPPGHWLTEMAETWMGFR